jgi:hypothetical protein
MTDPDKRNITDQRFHDDATLRYLMNTRPARTHAEWLAYFHEQFASSYIVTAPQAPGGHWRASATFGNNDQLFEWAPAELRYAPTGTGMTRVTGSRSPARPAAVWGTAGHER